jgi:hypothetical protein
MRHRRTKLRIVPDGASARRRPSPRPLEVMWPGILAGMAAATALKYYMARRRRNILEEAGVLTAEVHSNGHSKVELGSLDQFSG